MPSGLILFSLSKCPDLASILLREVDVTGWPGPAQIPGGAGEGCRGFHQANITAVLNYHKQMLAAQPIRNAIQSPCQSDPLQETPETVKLGTSNSRGQIYEGYRPCPGENCPQAKTPWGKAPWGSEQRFSTGVDFTPQQGMTRGIFVVTT